MSDDTVLILGAGPAGLFAAYACERLGASVGIMSNKVKSELPGAQYLHEPIPGLTGEPDGVIRTIRSGTAEAYAAKVYGDPKQPTSWDTVVEERPAWDLRAVYTKLWDRYQSRIQDTLITRIDLGELPSLFPLVISTIPAMSLCRGTSGYATDINHYFKWESMYVVDWAPPELPDNTVLYSGDPAQQWYRASRVFGHVSTEATQHCFDHHAVEYATPDADVRPFKKGIKVVGSNCDCRPEIKRAGRYGTWQKGYLTHHAYNDAERLYREAFGTST